jgi:hypothetical protein
LIIDKKKKKEEEEKKFVPTKKNALWELYRRRY